MISVISTFILDLFFVVIFLIGKVFYDETLRFDKVFVRLLAISCLMDVALTVLPRLWENPVVEIISKILLVLELLLWIAIYEHGGKGRRIRRFFLLLENMYVCVIGTFTIACLIKNLLFVWKKKGISSYTDEDPVIYFIIIVLLGGFGVYVFFKFYKKNIYLNLSVVERMILFGLTTYVIILIGFIEFVQESKKWQGLDVSIQIFLLLSTILMVLCMPVLMIKNKLSKFYEKGQEYQKEWLKQEISYFNEYKKNQEETRRFRHDVINHLNCIYALLQQNKSDKAQEYVALILKDVKELSPKVVTGNEMLDCIIMAKWSLFTEKQIQFTCEGILDKGLSMEPSDICSVFANALDNAIEACEQINDVSKRTIQMQIKKANGFYFILMKNTVLSSVESVSCKKIGFTTKKNKELHGYGLSNMKRTIETNQGHMEVTVEEGWFLLKIFLPI